MGASAQMPALAHMQPRRRKSLLADVARNTRPPGGTEAAEPEAALCRGGTVNEGEPLSGERVSVSAQSCFSYTHLT